MSKSTMEQRRNAYLAEFPSFRDSAPSVVFDHMRDFAAREVARVREAQVAVIPELRRIVGREEDGQALRGHQLLDIIDEATRPDAPRAKEPYRPRHKPGPGLPRLDDVLRERGLKHVGFVEKGGVVTDVNHKPVKPPMGRILGLSALARNVKKGKAR